MELPICRMNEQRGKGNECVFIHLLNKQLLSILSWSQGSRAEQNQTQSLLSSPRFSPPNPSLFASWLAAPSPDTPIPSLLLVRLGSQVQPGWPGPTVALQGNVGKLAVRWGRRTLSHAVSPAPPKKENGQFKTNVCAMKERKKFLWEQRTRERGGVRAGRSSLTT